MATPSETRVGRGTDSITVIHDADRCYGFLRRWGNLIEAWSSDDAFCDRLIGEFPGKKAAFAALMACPDVVAYERERTRERMWRVRAAAVSRTVAFVCDDHGVPVGMLWRKGGQWHAVSSSLCLHCGDHCDRMSSSGEERNALLATILGHIDWGVVSLQ